MKKQILENLKRYINIRKNEIESRLETKDDPIVEQRLAIFEEIENFIIGEENL